jgi:hypothetical protein
MNASNDKPPVFAVSLRDYFAANAPPADHDWIMKYATDQGLKWFCAADAKTAWAFYWADCMLEARKPK